MKKQTMAVVMAAAFVVAVAGAVWAANCDVVGTKGNEVTLKCDDASKLKAGDKMDMKGAAEVVTVKGTEVTMKSDNASKMKAGDKVTLKAAAAAKHKGKIEGC